MKKLLIYGAGGFGKEILELAQSSSFNKYENFLFIDDTLIIGTFVCNAMVIGNGTLLSRLSPEEYDVSIAVGNPRSRYTLVLEVERLGFTIPTLVDATALIRPSAQIGQGVIVCARATISSEATIQNHVVINIGALVGHDVSVGAFSVISPNSLVLGRVNIGDGVEIGAGASLYPRIKIGEWSKIAMGAAVYRDVDARAIVSGNPARTIMRVQ